MAERFDAEVVAVLRRRLRSRANPQPVRALQRAHQVRGVARPGPGAGLRRCGDRSSRPAVPTDRAGPRLLRSVDRGQGPVLRPRDAASAAAGAAHCSRWAIRPSSRCGPRRRSRGLAVADKPDSHDICFIADGDTAGYLRRRLGAQPGPIVDRDGTVLGGHEGAFSYTVGQRRGLRLGGPAADGRPRYVLGVDPVSTGRRGRPRARRSTVAPDRGRGQHLHRAPAAPAARSCARTGRPVPARADPRRRRQGCGRVPRPVRGVAPGQAVVLYDEADEQVLGGATISRVPVGGRQRGRG